MTTFELFPAIDLLGGRCVRLYQGDYDQATTYDDDPVARALGFRDAGARWIHVVDLDAARTGEPVNRRAIAAIAAAVDVPVQVGGGVRDHASAADLYQLGVARVVVGTAALEDPAFVRILARDARVAVGLDVRGREVAVRGWTEGSGRYLAEVAAEFADAGVEALIVTQIARDGTLEGPDVEGLVETLQASAVPVVASGGVGELVHITELAQMEVAGRGLAGVIVGRAIYEGRVDVASTLDAIAAAGAGRR